MFSYLGSLGLYYLNQVPKGLVKMLGKSIKFNNCLYFTYYVDTNKIYFIQFTPKPLVLA